MTIQLHPINNFSDMNVLVRPHHRAKLEQMGEAVYRFGEIEHDLRRVILESQEPQQDQKYVQKFALLHSSESAVLISPNRWLYSADVAGPDTEGEPGEFVGGDPQIFAINLTERWNTANMVDGSPVTINGATITFGPVGTVPDPGEQQQVPVLLWGPYWETDAGEPVYLFSRSNPIISVECA